ncbi:MAG: hypothetical protein PHW95_02630 [Patescibacteria group bacterium]|nr:hypothetical protein [Patescibacteria group bacterium]
MNNFLNSKKNYLVFTFTVVYLAAFTFNSIINANYEFLYYTFLISFIIYLIFTIHQKLHLAFFILINLSLMGFFHLLGGNFYLHGNVRLYDYYIIPGIFRYDNFVHTYGAFIGTLTLYSLLNLVFDERVKKRYFIFSFILVLMAMGMGTIVEIVEFIGAMTFNAWDQVGDYTNNALDLVFNTLGAILAATVIYFYRNPPNFIRKINAQPLKDN